MYNKKIGGVSRDTIATLRRLLLDSSLIVTTNLEKYNVKMVNCNNYIQLYISNARLKKSNDLELMKINSINNTCCVNQTPNIKVKKENIIEEKNIIRSKLECQRLAKANMEEWKSFITLTFKENVTDIRFANKRLRFFIDKVKRVYNNFKYICIPEFQKRGAVHYHLLTNIGINDEKLVFEQENNKRFKHIKYWLDGFTSVEPLKGDVKKIIGYIAKYMTKDIDNRLFNCHRYFYSRNLNKPIISYLDLSKEENLNYINTLLSNKKIIYKNEYLNSYSKDKVQFIEYL